MAIPQSARAQNTITLPQIDITTTRLGGAIAGTSSTIITADEIARTPAQTLPDILALAPGVQLRSLSGGTSGAQSTVDLRGFGAFASANTLILINGRRLNDLDLAGIDLSSIPVQSVERIEIIRGNSGAVLYGDNAVGGVINIVTKTGAGSKPSLRIEVGFGSFNRREGNISAQTSHGGFSASAFGSAIKSDGYRQNNRLTQENATGDIRYTSDAFSAYLALSGDNQTLGLPGARRVTLTTSQIVTDPRGATTPFDHAEKSGLNATTGVTFKPFEGLEIIVDGGVRTKSQQGSFYGTVPLNAFSAAYVDSHLTTWSLTPRLKIKNNLLGLPSEILTGVDFYDANYDSNRSQYAYTRPIHVYNLDQQTAALYWQQTVGILSTTDVSFGARIQNTRLNARDTYDPTAPNAFDVQAFPLKTSENQHALHFGVEHRITDELSVFGRAARAFRTPNVDERLVTGPAFDINNFFAPLPQNFQLKTQTSYDIEGGVRFHRGTFEAQASVYDMRLRNEIHFYYQDAANFIAYNTNLDPTRRTGVELAARYGVTESFRIKGSLTQTRATFRDGIFAGNDVPLVSRWTGTFGASWDIWQKYVVLDAIARYSSARRFDNDQRNFQPMIPAATFVDMKLSGEVDRFFWSLAVNNVFDRKTFDYGVASATTYGTYNAYPLPGRNYVLKAGMTF